MSRKFAGENPFAIADTCFLIDWAAWRKRDILFSIFKTVFVPESVLKEVKSEGTIEWIANSLSQGFLMLFTETSDVLGMARDLIERSRLIPEMRGIDLPEAICLAAGKLRGYLVLTENRGALMAVDLMDDVSDVIVWRSLELIAEAIRRGIISGDPVDIFRGYEMDTKHRFPREDLEEILDELRGEA